MTEPKIAGRRYTRTRRDVFENGAEHREIHPDSLPRVADRMARAVEELETAGIPARYLLNQDPGGAFLVERVLYLDDHESDSPLGIAAQIVRACCQLQRNAELYGANPRMLADAFALGRLVTLRRAYTEGDAQRREAAAKPRRLDPLRALLVEAFSGDKRAGRTLKEAIASLEAGNHVSLRLTYATADDVFLATDENGADDTRPYTLKGLESLWTAAG